MTITPFVFKHRKKLLPKLWGKIVISCSSVGRRGVYICDVKSPRVLGRYRGFTFMELEDKVDRRSHRRR